MVSPSLLHPRPEFLKHTPRPPSEKVSGFRNLATFDVNFTEGFRNQQLHINSCRDPASLWVSTMPGHSRFSGHLWRARPKRYIRITASKSITSLVLIFLHSVAGCILTQPLPRESLSSGSRRLWATGSNPSGALKAFSTPQLASFSSPSNTKKRVLSLDQSTFV